VSNETVKAFVLTEKKIKKKLKNGVQVLK
jgi:hypothetical protein